MINKEMIEALAPFRNLYERDLRGLPPETVVFISGDRPMLVRDFARLASLYRQATKENKRK